MNRVSSLLSTPCSVEVPSAKAAHMSARLVILFDPGGRSEAASGPRGEIVICSALLISSSLEIICRDNTDGDLRHLLQVFHSIELFFEHDPPCCSCGARNDRSDPATRAPMLNHSTFRPQQNRPPFPDCRSWGTEKSTRWNPADRTTGNFFCGPTALERPMSAQ